MEELAKRAVKILKERKLKISIAESLTGGMLASQFCSVSGASDVFIESVVCYSEISKINRLRITEEEIKKYTTVSSEISSKMAENIRKCCMSDIGISTTGVAGPDEFDKYGNPKGLFYISLSMGDDIYTKKFMVDGSRNEIRKKVVEEAIKMLISILEK